MKRLAAVAVMVASFSCGAFAQHGGGSHGGGGFSGGHAGFSAPAGGFAGRSAPAFNGGFSRAPGAGFSRPMSPGYPRYGSGPASGLARYAPRPTSYPGGAFRPATGGPRMPATTGAHRAPYSPYGGNHYHYGYHYHYPYNHVVYVSSVWPYWGYPYGYGWGYPYYGLGYSGFFDDSDNYNSQQPSYYSAPQAPDSYGPYQQPPPTYQQPPYPQPEDQQQQPAPETYPPPNAARAPYSGTKSALPASEALTVVFKDGRPPEQVYNYMLTANTLTVLDQHRHDIPVDQIDLEATAKVNIQAGVEFSLPVRTP